jgi:GT2 family glycosyltransferase
VTQDRHVTAVVVTYNRRDLLRESLQAVMAQTTPVGRVIVIDNASDDGTQEMLATEFPQLDIHRLASNTGGAGGFARGIELARASETDWIWLMDDDTVPTQTALERLLVAHSRFPGDQSPVVLGSVAVWTDGRLHPMNVTPPRLDGPSSYLAAERGCVSVRTASFVSLMVSAEVARKEALPEAGYFIWNDDVEYTGRVLRERLGVVVTDSIVVHKTKQFGGAWNDPGERLYYAVRNHVWMLLKSTAFAGEDRVLYGGAAARFWFRSLTRSPNRSTAARLLARGLKDGLLRSPRRFAAP